MAESLAADLIEILDPSAPKFDLAKYTDHVRSLAAGAIATFDGTTRDTFDSKCVLELRYESYIPMAHRQVSSILASARSRWSLTRIAVAHRLGVVPVGEASVLLDTIRIEH